MARKTKHPCAECGQLNPHGYLCDPCVRKEDVRKRHGIWTSADFSGFAHLNAEERQLLFMWACGIDIRDYLGADTHPLPRNFDTGELLDDWVHNPAPFFKGAYDEKYHYLLYGEEPVKVEAPSPDVWEGS